MKRFRIAAVCAALLAAPLPRAWAYFVMFKEEFYRLYHVHYQQFPEDCAENIYWLEKAAAADFCNPQFALARIEDEAQWEKYRYLFMMHVNLKLIEQHVRLGRTWDKRAAHFYDGPWKDAYLAGLDKAEACYRTALVYWTEAKNWCEKANAGRFRFLFLTDTQYWEDERERIASGALDYGKTLARELSRLEAVRRGLQALK